MKSQFSKIVLLAWFALMLPLTVVAEDEPPPPPVPEDMPAVPAAPASKGPQNGALPISNRSKSLDFDNDVIEGMNKNPLDSLTRLGKNDDKQQGHLYHRKPHFKREIRQSVQEMGYTQ